MPRNKARHPARVIPAARSASMSWGLAYALHCTGSPAAIIASSSRSRSGPRLLRLESTNRTQTGSCTAASVRSVPIVRSTGSTATPLRSTGSVQNGQCWRQPRENSTG